MTEHPRQDPASVVVVVAADVAAADAVVVDVVGSKSWMSEDEDNPIVAWAAFENMASAFWVRFRGAEGRRMGGNDFTLSLLFEKKRHKE